MANVSAINISKEQIEKAHRLLSHLGDDAAKKAISRAMVRAMDSSRAGLIRQIGYDYTVSPTKIRDSIRMNYPNKNRLVGYVGITGKPIALINFKVNPATVNPKRKTPIRVGVSHGKQKSMGSAFIARYGNSLGIYERVGKARLPIKQMFGPSIPQMADNPRVVDAVSEIAEIMFESRLHHEIGRILDKEGAK